MNWLKLVGATGDPIAEDWAHEEAHNFTEIRFPWNKPPSNVWSPGRFVLYAVGSTALIAVQSVDGPPQINPRRGPAGSRDNRWPHAIKVQTHHFCSPVSSAPLLREVAPEVADKYAKLFRNGSHWQITDEEYEKLAAAIERNGRRYHD
jgi:hypothetical protein